MRKIDFPTNNEEFMDLLIYQNAANVESWVFKEKQFDRTDVIRYLFLREIWRGIENPADSTFTQTHLEHRLWRYKKNPRLENGEVLAVLEKMLASGISGREISTLVREMQFALAHYILYKLDDTEADHEPEIASHMLFGIYLEDEDGNPVPGSRLNCLHELFSSARPASFPPVD